MRETIKPKMTNNSKDILHELYLVSRKLLSHKTLPDICIQRSFEEAMNGARGDDVWRPTHISQEAINLILDKKHKEVQRAHGVLDDRLSRFDRTIRLLSGDEQKFQLWWEFYCYHDSTVLISRQEHVSNKKFTQDSLISIPKDLNLFQRSGFSFKVRKNQEISWLNSLVK